MRRRHVDEDENEPRVYDIGKRAVAELEILLLVTALDVQVARGLGHGRAGSRKNLLEARELELEQGTYRSEQSLLGRRAFPDQCRCRMAAHHVQAPHH